MRLARVTIAGFKSFADVTEFQFDAPITGIVGPNGCGKSNVVDALKWVLGERSAKSLRGDAMLDVIFAGSAARQPLGAASVTLTFDNPVLPLEARGPSTPDHGRLLNLDSEQVDVSRRLYRDGRSEYLINDSKCRLRDIRDLFLDTGIGTHAYAIIEQGRVEAMLTTNPLERRAVLEEAAGVAKFKVRKIEAQRKLERSEINLVQVRERLASTERRLRAVRRAAEKARRFRELDARYRQLRTDLTLDQYHELRERQADLVRRLGGLEGRRAELASTLRDLEDDRQTREIARHDLARAAHACGARRAELQAIHKHAAQRREMSQRALEQAAQQVDEERARARELDGRRAEIARQLEACESAIAAAAEQAADDERHVARLSGERARLQQEVLAAQETADAARESARDAHQRLAQRQSQLESIDDRCRELDRHAERLSARLQHIAGERERHELASAESRGALEDAGRRVEALEQALAQQEAAVAALGEQQAAAARAVAELRHQRAAIESRLLLLEEMQQAREGLGEGVRRVLERLDEFPGVRGLLADLIDADREHAPLVEAALGRDLDLLLVDDTIDDTSSLARLAEGFANLRGRVSLVAASWLQETPADPEPPPGCTPLLGLVRVAPEAAAAVQRLLCRTFVVDGLTTALELGARHRGLRFVTRAGELVEPDGRIVARTAGPAGVADGWLSRRAELGELRRHIARIDGQLADADRRLQDVAGQSETAREQRRAAEEQLHRARHRLVESQYALRRLGDESSRLERERMAAEAESSELAQRRRNLDGERSGLEQHLAELKIDQERQSAEAVAAGRCVEQAREVADHVAEQLTAARVQLGQDNEKLEAARRERRHLAAGAEESERLTGLCHSQLNRRLSQVEQTEAAAADAAQEMADSLAGATVEAERLVDLEAQVRSAEQQLHEASARVQHMRNECETIDRTFHALELDRREVEVKRESLEERATTELELDLGQAYVPHRSLREEEGFTPVDRTITEQELGGLRDEIRSLGSVNLDAIVEESELTTQNEALAAQLADLDAARIQLQDLISDLDRRSLERFRETFEAVREHFAGPAGTFRALFGGGNADLLLLPDENGHTDWLSCGVEIRAKPPGKEPRVLNQLSGGEKTMTAVALLMAIFKSKPSPFCVLDEVDAALDDANIDRYCNIVQQFLDRSHFIIITHNKRTMMGCDRLYGITMQERGVSKRVAVRLEQIGDNGVIDRSALREAEAAERAAAAQPRASEPVVAEPPLIETKPARVPREVRELVSEKN